MQKKVLTLSDHACTFIAFDIIFKKLPFFNVVFAIILYSQTNCRNFSQVYALANIVLALTVGTDTVERSSAK